MNLKIPGMVIAGIGALLIVVTFILVIVMGSNAETIAEIGNKDDPTKADRKDVESAQETNAFLATFSTGLASLGMGAAMIGGGCMYAKNKKGNTKLLGIAGAAIVILLANFIVSTYTGYLDMREQEIDNIDDPKESDEKDAEGVEESQAFMGPMNAFCGGTVFGMLFLSLGGFPAMALLLSLACLIIGAFIGSSGKKIKIKKKKVFEEAYTAPPVTQQYAAEYRPDPMDGRSPPPGRRPPPPPPGY